MITDPFITFNLLEGVWWVVCALISIFLGVRFKYIPTGFWYVLGADFFLFGLSDFVEAFYPISFLAEEGEWLLMWKATCIAVFLGCVAWYVRRRIPK